MTTSWSQPAVLVCIVLLPLGPDNCPATSGEVPSTASVSVPPSVDPEYAELAAAVFVRTRFRVSSATWLIPTELMTSGGEPAPPELGPLHPSDVLAELMIGLRADTARLDRVYGCAAAPSDGCGKIVEDRVIVAVSAPYVRGADTIRVMVQIWAPNPGVQRVPVTVGWHEVELDCSRRACRATRVTRRGVN